MCLDSGNKLAGTEGLCHIIIGAQSQSANLINVILLGGDHNDRSILSFPYLTADFKSIHLRQHQIQNDQIKIFIQCSGGSTAAIGLQHDFKVAELQIIFLQFCDCCFVFNDQYSCHILIPPICNEFIRNDLFPLR